MRVFNTWAHTFGITNPLRVVHFIAQVAHESGGFRYVEELRRMGARIKVDGRVLVIEGGAPLSPAPVIATDLRGGVAVMIAALTAKGVTEISEIQLIERGYDDICGKLRSLGADIRKIVVPEDAALPRAN